MLLPASVEHRANFNDRLIGQFVDRQRFDDLSKRPRYHRTITATSADVAVAGKISAGPRVVHWNLSRRSLGLFGYADDLPLSGGTTGRMANKGRRVGGRWPLLCRFSDAGMRGPSPRSANRRPKSAKAGNRGVWGTNGAAGAMGIWRRRECLGSWVEADDRIALARILGVRAGANERIARCSTGIAVRSRGHLADRSKRVWCRARAGQNGALRCGAGSAMTAS